ncbi:MAG TPA: hypothetical protein PK760_09595, partial [Flavobacteriales bacterium]|nr:hypothetical protein [Flavobacteriales bacterium]
ANLLGQFYIRIRLSVDSFAVTIPYMAAARGETEDYVWESVGQLPVELISFSGTDEVDDVRLDWSTASESNTDHFLIERSRDAMSFTFVGTMSAAGHSIARRDYLLHDEHPLDGLAYYRLVEVDIDGTTTTTATIAVEHRAGGNVWLQVLNDMLLVHGLDGERLDARVLDAGGRTMPVRMISTNAIDISGWPSGVYGLVLGGSDAPMKRFVIVSHP